ncbi:MAG: hypothetical protein GY915_04505 [bacterium]|nr:hypothetical protein [bacterium]
MQKLKSYTLAILAFTLPACATVLEVENIHKQQMVCTASSYLDYCIDRFENFESSPRDYRKFVFKSFGSQRTMHDLSIANAEYLFKSASKYYQGELHTQDLLSMVK